MMEMMEMMEMMGRMERMGMMETDLLLELRRTARDTLCVGQLQRGAQQVRAAAAAAARRA